MNEKKEFSATIQGSIGGGAIVKIPLTEFPIVVLLSELEEMLNSNNFSVVSDDYSLSRQTRRIEETKKKYRSKKK